MEYDDDWYGDDNDRQSAYERALGDFIQDDFELNGDDLWESTPVPPETFIEFANIVQGYDREARPEHDDIEFDSSDLDNLDGVEFDDVGEIVVTYGVILGVLDAIIEFGSFADIPDDLEFAEDDPQFPLPDASHRFRFPLWNPRKAPCKGHRGAFYNSRYPGQPPV